MEQPSQSPLPQKLMGHAAFFLLSCFCAVAWPTDTEVFGQASVELSLEMDLNQEMGPTVPNMSLRDKAASHVDHESSNSVLWPV
eukprot:2226345-Amphidinium_carterae.1